MLNVRKKVPNELREQITKESLGHGCKVSELAKSYGVSEKSIYNWRREYKQVGSGSEPASKFVELTVKEPEVKQLKKAELIFDDISVLLEGRISCGRLLELIKVLEAPC